MKGVRDALTRLDGVHTVKVDLQENRVAVTPHPSKEISLKSIPEAIKKAGFVPDDMWIKATGIVVQSNGTPRFRIKNWKSMYPMKMKSPPEGEFELKASVLFQKDPPVLQQRASSGKSSSRENNQKQTTGGVPERFVTATFKVANMVERDDML